jgi:NAD(P)-dependent dehydrogenase (short-subunit alcohol dehydrogenase family)
MEKLSFKSRVVIITGGESIAFPQPQKLESRSFAANGELGGAYARLLSERGATVVCVDLNPGVHDFAKTLPTPAMACVCNITSQDDIQRTVDSVIEAHGRIDAIINSAGFAYQRKFADTSVEDAKKLFDMHYWGPFMFNKAVWPHMAKAGYGRIVNITSSSILGLEEWANVRHTLGSQLRS